MRTRNSLLLRPRQILVAASAGGHWVQIRRLRSAWVDLNVCYLTTSRGYRDEIEEENSNNDDCKIHYIAVDDANINEKHRLITQFIQILSTIIWIRPSVVISTGASVGYFALMVGKILGAKTIWVDSIANSDTISLSGQKVQPFSDLFITQWSHLEQVKPGGRDIVYAGAVI
ncbi:MAG: UDP-N-acetylglucosamine--LPS N-acetylglucosamine transferase [Pseudomonadota bacterium]